MFLNRSQLNKFDLNLLLTYSRARLNYTYEYEKLVLLFSCCCLTFVFVNSTHNIIKNIATTALPKYLQMQK